MHRQLESSGFTGSFSKVNGIHHMGLSRRKLARALIALGPHQSRGPVSGFFWWACNGLSLALSQLDHDFRPSFWFRRAPNTLRGMHSYRIAEGLTRWFAQEHLRIDLLVPLEFAPFTVTKAASAKSFPKQMPPRFRQSVKIAPKAEPDFIGISGSSYHVIESKGRADFRNHQIARTTINTARNKGLRQVCRIEAVNGEEPETRCACVFAFDNVGTQGQITDPPKTDTYRIEAPLHELVRSAYRVVLDPLFLENRRDIGDGVEGLEFAPGWKFGIEREVLKPLLAVQDEDSARRFCGFLAARGRDREEEELEQVSLGRDGLALYGVEPDDRFRRLRG